MKILLVDDFETTRLGLKHVLAEALDCLERDEWNLIVIDLNVPDRNGLDVLVALQARGGKPRVLVFSAAPEQECARRATSTRRPALRTFATG
jgi:DNA-binding NarL/FixJ family response regulator